MADTNTSSDTTPQPATYASLFPEQLANRCSPDALESNNGPIAYLYALYQQALELEATSTSDKRFTLAQRRPDIAELVLSREGLEKEVPPLTLAIKALTRQANMHVESVNAAEKKADSDKGATKDKVPFRSKGLAERISESQCRAGLPFHYPLEQIQAVLRHKKIPLFDLLQRSEYSFPNFCKDNLRTDELRQVMRNATGFSPSLQALLLDATSADAEGFLSARFGDAATLENLNKVAFFCQRTGLKTEDVLDLLAIAGIDDNASEGKTAVKRSDAYAPRDSTVDSSRYGAAFINNGTSPALTLRDINAEAGIELSITGTTAAHFGRAHKLIHLRHTLNLSFAETDLLLMSILRAEGQSKDFHITANTLRALGVYRYFKEAYGVTAEQFSALVHQVTPYAVGDQVPFLDRVLDGPGAGLQAQINDLMVIDDAAFDPSATDDAGNNAARGIIGQLSKAFGADEQWLNASLIQIKQALGIKTFTKSLDLVSSLYRLSRLPRLLRMTLGEGTSLIALLASDTNSVLGTLAGRGRITDDPENADILDVLIALANIERWLRTNNLKASAVLALVSKPQPSAMILFEIEKARERFRTDGEPDVLGVTLSQEKIKTELGSTAALKSSTDTWQTLLKDYLDEKGLIKESLPAEKPLKEALGTLLKGKLADSNSDTTQASETLASLLINARVQQEDLAKSIFTKAFADVLASSSSASTYALPILKWIKSSAAGLLAEVMQPVPIDAKQMTTSLKFWTDITRCSFAVKLTGVSPAGLEALAEHPEWLDFEADVVSGNDATTTEPRAINLSLHYQLTRYRDWIALCRKSGFEEQDALDYLSSMKDTSDVGEVQVAAAKMGKLIVWPESEVVIAMPQIAKPQHKTKPGTFDDFVTTMSDEERKFYRKSDGRIDIKKMLYDLHWIRAGYVYKNRAQESTVVKLHKYAETLTSATLEVTQSQYNECNQTETWGKRFSAEERLAKKPYQVIILKLKVYQPDDDYDGDPVPITPTTLGDIDFILRLQSLCNRTALSCQSLIDLSWLNEGSSFDEFQSIGQLLLATCTDDIRALVESGLLEQWRDALIHYLLGYWVPKKISSTTSITDTDELCSYFLTDIGTSWEAKKTTVITQAIASLQHYLFRLFSHLEPGYETANVPSSANQQWKRYLSQYGTWKAWRAQINHPENLIYYANRPNKSNTFQELEVEVNQGKLDTELLETAVCNYLTKFERLSNLQIVSGYLDGRDPLNDTYHLIGKTNASPTEYYWRSVDMGLRDDQQRLSPLAWSEWKKIDLTVTGVIAQSQYIEQFDKVDADGKVQKDDKGNVLKDSSKNVTHTCDAIRPVIIAGRPYVFWVERGTTGLPSNDGKSQTPTQFKKLSVQYTYLQSDGFWSTANELICLDGTEDGQRRSDKEHNFLKDESYIPGLIVFVNTENERRQDPWLTVILHDCRKPAAGPGNINKDYFVEMRDLLLINRKQLPVESLEKLTNVTLKTYEDIRFVQHIYDGTSSSLTALKPPKHTKLDGLIYGVLFNLTSNIKLATTATAPQKRKVFKPYSSRDATALTLESTHRIVVPAYVKNMSETVKEKLKAAAATFDDARKSYEYSKIYHSEKASHAIIKSTFEKAESSLLKVTEAILSSIASKAMTFKIELPFTTKKTLKIEAHYQYDDAPLKHALSAFGVEIKSPSDLNFEPLAEGQLAHITTLYDYTEEGTYEFQAYIILDGIKVYETHYTYEISSSKTDESWNVAILNNTEQAQYLDLTSVDDRSVDIPKRIRLNTLFGKQLVARASQSVERALAWDTQKLKEPTIDENVPNPSVDFHGANGIYFRELFLHLPALIATRLTEQQQFEDAESWYLRNLFDPYRAVADDDGRPAYWNTRPLAEVGTLTSELNKPVDPTARAFILSRYYRQAVFLGLVENWQRQGDHYYRQLTLSSLNHAWLCYQQALKLVGPLPERTEVSRWIPLKLSDIDESLFFTPINQRVLDARKTLERRLYQLRHGLTIDGKALPDLGWRDEEVDPFASARGGLSIIATTYNSGRTPIPAYRFRQILPTTRAAVQQLLDFGRHYMKLMEDEFNTTFSVLMKSQEIRMSDFALRLGKEAISAVLANKQTLQLGLRAAEARKARFEALLDVGKSPMEEAATGLSIVAKVTQAAAVPFEITAGIAAAMTPTIFGMAFGGNKPEQPMARTASTLLTTSNIADFAAGQLIAEAGYERRASEWQFEMEQANWDIKALSQQIEQVDIELNAATISLEEAKQERANLDEAYVAMTTGFTIIPIYNWLVARQELIYGKAYDAVLSLCLGLEAAWRYEIGDYKRNAFIKTSAWSDTYKGMLAGESLLVDLQEMENAYLSANERRLTIKKSFSLTKLLTSKGLTSGLNGLATNKPLLFEFKASDFDKNYPGHYLRQLKHVSVSFILKEGSKAEEMSAILTQIGNSTLIEPHAKGAEYYYGEGKEPPASIKRNLRAQQQIALSSLVSEDGLGFAPGEWVYELMFHDGRYLPFEGTGAISQWQLEIPDIECAESLKSAVSDIQINLVYTALDGGSELVTKVRELYREAKKA
ncbi:MULTISPECIES: neuraminidase-like domain-containing protein [unclassified Pseudomonas]|uniref:Tc toxin subunit A-related protein n=1 Tax=unclassified Pseudomonas TaxID=196821 RepID=UPI0013140F9E|nr:MULTISPECIES: neuraminidase-like domain-containing protein [unclassified Pseudomonas]